MLGEMDIVSGSVSQKSKEDLKVAYVAQQAWIQNLSLKDNILFDRPFHLSSYNSAIDVCALLPDIAMLTKGDATEIGENIKKPLVLWSSVSTNDTPSFHEFS